MATKGKPATSSSTTNQNQTTTVNPFGGASGILNQMIGGASSAYDATNKTPYAGSYYAAPNQNQIQAQSSTLAQAAPSGTGADAMRNIAMKSLNGGYLDPTQNAPLQAAIQAGIDPLRKQLHQNVMSIGDAAQAQGAYGGSRQGVVEGTALGDFNSHATDLAAGMNYQDYATERQNQLNAGALLDHATQIGLMPGQIQDAVGGEQQQQAQAQLDANHQQFNDAQQAPWAGLGNLSQIFQLLQPYGTSTTTGTGTSNGTSTSEVKGTSALSNILGVAKMVGSVLAAPATGGLSLAGLGGGFGGGASNSVPAGGMTQGGLNIASLMGR
jgi:hypothetical protein